jgi:hypothetical protein
VFSLSLSDVRREEVVHHRAVVVWLVEVPTVWHRFPLPPLTKSIRPAVAADSTNGIGGQQAVKEVMHKLAHVAASHRPAARAKARAKKIISFAASSLLALPFLLPPCCRPALPLSAWLLIPAALQPEA